MLVSREDYQGNLLSAIDKRCSIRDKRIADFGTGTGRISFLMADLADCVRGFDMFPSMIEVAEDKRKAAGITNCSFSVADSRSVPLQDGEVEIAVEGWSFALMANWNKDSWKDVLVDAIDEMNRVVKKGGGLVLVETLGTMEETPNPPPGLLPIYDFYENELGFTRDDWIRTDYRFDSVEHAVDLTMFFFGDEMGARVSERNSNYVPECTGIWYRS